MGTAHRVQTLSLLKIDQIFVQPSGIDIHIVDLIKASRAGKSQPTFFIPFFTKNPSLCLARCLVRYLEISRSLRRKKKFWY